MTEMAEMTQEQKDRALDALDELAVLAQDEGNYFDDMPWKEPTPNGLIQLFKTIPRRDYDGHSHSQCLVGFPLYRGVLSAEWGQYLIASFRAPEESTMTMFDWLAKRYHVDRDRLHVVFNAVAEYGAIDYDLTNAIDFAEQYLVKDTQSDVQEALRALGLKDRSLDEEVEDEEYEDDDEDEEDQW
jgi:hypothetical protein